MKHIKIFLFWLLVLSIVSAIEATGATDQCATTSSSTSTQYINSTITLKILLVEFQDIQHRVSPSAYTKIDFESMLVSSGVYVKPNMYTPDGDEVYGSMQDYYQKMSSGNLTITGYVVNTSTGGIPNWIILPNTKSYYHSFDYWNSPIFTDAVNTATSAGLDVSTSSTVKLVIIYAGNTYWQLKGLNPMASGNSYIMSERQGDPGTQENPGDKFARIGVHCHEFAHLLGIGHASGSRADLMEAGTRNGSVKFNAPAPLNPAHRALKGWLTPTVITSQQQFDAYYSLTAPQVFRINSNYNNDYFLFENRRFNQTMVIGTTTVPDYNNAAFFPPAWPHGSITEGIFAWRIINGNTGGYNTNGLIYASGNYGSTCPEGTPSETDDGVPFPGNCDVRVLSPWSDSRNPYITEGNHYTIYVPNTKNSTNVGMEVVSENSTAGYFTIKLYQTNPQDASPSKVSDLITTSIISNSTSLSWAANQEPDLVGYNIYRGVVYTGSGEPSYTKINSTPITMTTYTDNNYEPITGLPQNIDLYHRYRITAVDNQSKESVKSYYLDAYFTHIACGTISTNRTYQINVNVIGDVTFQNGTTLAILPGTTVKFAAGKKLTTMGALSAVGTSTNRITFTSASTTPQPGDWSMISLQGGPDNITYCDIQYATWGLVPKNTSTHLIDHCTIENCANYGVYAYTTPKTANIVKIQYCIIRNNLVGIGLNDARVDLLQTTIQNNTNQYGGVYAVNSKFYTSQSSIINNTGP
jgi:M6 family metalloprotease-like protein